MSIWTSAPSALVSLASLHLCLTNRDINAMDVRFAWQFGRHDSVASFQSVCERRAYGCLIRKSSDTGDTKIIIQTSGKRYVENLKNEKKC